MDAELAALPDDVDALKVALLAARADVAAALAEQSSNRALIAHLKLQIEVLNRDRFGPRSERTARLLDQMELQLEEMEAAATEDELAAEAAAAKTTSRPRLYPQAPSPATAPRAPAARAYCRTQPSGMRLLRRHPPVQARRGHHRDPGGRTPHLEGHPACAGEVLLPRL